MPDGRNQNSFVTDEVCDVVGKARDVDAPVATGPLTPEKRLTNDRRADALDLGTKPCPQARNAPLVVSGRLLAITLGLREKLEHCAHWPGAISRSRAKTSAAGIG